ncbi:MAG: DUF2442 domain-containing protein [Mogibacterium sp.]|nr:DUF2442 domain-containing protein [Mogibacterium sp.]
MEYIPTVIQVVPQEDYKIYVYFSDGCVRLADIYPLIEQGGVFAPLKDKALFREKLTVMNHAVAWDISGNRDPRECIDIDPCSVYEKSEIVSDPLKCA